MRVRPTEREREREKERKKVRERERVHAQMSPLVSTSLKIRESDIYLLYLLFSVSASVILLFRPTACVILLSLSFSYVHLRH